MLYLVHNSSLSFLLSTKQHHNCTVNIKTHLFISSTILTFGFLSKEGKKLYICLCLFFGTSV